MTRLLSIGILLLLLGAACAPAAPTPAASTTPQGERPAANQVLRVGRLSLPPSLSPESSFNAFFDPLYDTLTVLGPKFTPIPAAAEKWEYVDDAWRFTLRDGLTFWNGQKVTVEDVIFSVELVANTAHPSKLNLPLMNGAYKVDDRTVAITSRTRDGMLPNGAHGIYIFPKDYYERLGKDEFGKKPLGTGPYEPVSYDVNTGAVFRQRSTPHLFRKPTITEIHYRVIPDLAQQVVGLRVGELDLVPVSTFSAEQVQQMKNAGLQIQLYDNASIMNGLFSQPEAERRNSPLRDKRVRQALNYAVDKESMVNILYKDQAVMATQLTVPGTPSYDETNKGYPYNPALAKRLLAEAGYPNGFKLPMGIGFTAATIPPDVPTIIQAGLREIGVEAQVNAYEYGFLLDKYYGRNNQEKDDIFLQSSGDANGTFSVPRGLYTCEKEGAARWWCTPEFDRLWVQASQEIDPAKRNALLLQASKVLHDDVPTLLLIQRHNVTAYRPNIRLTHYPFAHMFDTIYRVE
ncbi:MAG: ABC transporter substrate-binding protein [Dehalococcoidia bacterium]|nr:MAG: ABC transporter substrate-binding protein [Dehalococcoidia bacterium]